MTFNEEPPIIGDGTPVTADNTTLVGGQYGKACRFEGNGRVVIGPVDIPQEGAWALWLRLDPKQPADKKASIFGCNGAGFAVLDKTVTASFNDGRTKDVVVGKATITPGKWTHLALVWGKDKRSFYLNGEEIASTDYSGKPRADEAKLTIGCRWSGSGRHLYGEVDELQTYERWLDTDDVAAIATKEYPH